MRIARRLVHDCSSSYARRRRDWAAAIIVAETAWFKNWLRGYIVREASQVSERSVAIERLGRQSVLRRRARGHRCYRWTAPPGRSVKDIGLDLQRLPISLQGAVDLTGFASSGPAALFCGVTGSWRLSRLDQEQVREDDREGPQSPDVQART